ncbi:MoaD/ThiS family protein [Ascidiimonas aurantiaca]|uniref:MoaD/ThiS family protein n=1 Tax=Ascidiimonas aurantiaca TaxID=1685432 RepID=UPI0030EC74F9
MRILLFGITRDIVGASVLNVDKNSYPLTTVRDLKTHLVNKYPDLAALSSLVIAVNNEYARMDTTIREKDEIALIPPVSGG